MVSISFDVWPLDAWLLSDNEMMTYLQGRGEPIPMASLSEVSGLVEQVIRFVILDLWLVMRGE